MIDYHDTGKYFIIMSICATVCAFLAMSKSKIVKWVIILLYRLKQAIILCTGDDDLITLKRNITFLVETCPHVLIVIL